MRLWLTGLGALIIKELRLEARGKETVTMLFCNAILACALVGVGTSSAFLDKATTTRLYPMLLWILFLLSASASAVRAHEQELEGRGLEGLLLAGASGAQMFLSKLIVMSALFFAHFLVLALVLGVALDQDAPPTFVAMIGAGLGSSTALASVTVLLSAVAGTSRLRGVLLPLLSLPLLFPVFFCGVEMTSQVVVGGGLDPASPWPLILVCANALYLVLGINLFEAAVRE
jgi:heme exporter protein B